jgi:hypothetical protein
MSMGIRAGGLPSKWTMPVMVAAVAGSAGVAVGRVVAVVVVSAGVAACLQAVRVSKRRRRAERFVTVSLWEIV